MTQDDQDAIIGKAHRDFRETKTKLAALEARGKEIAQAAHNLGDYIVDPTRVIVASEGESVVVAGLRNPLLFGTEMAKLLSQEYVRQYITEHRATKQRLGALRQQLINLGQGDPEKQSGD